MFEIYFFERIILAINDAILCILINDFIFFY